MNRGIDEIKKVSRSIYMLRLKICMFISRTIGFLRYSTFLTQMKEADAGIIILHPPFHFYIYVCFQVSP